MSKKHELFVSVLTISHFLNVDIIDWGAANQDHAANSEQ